MFVLASWPNVNFTSRTDLEHPIYIPSTNPYKFILNIFDMATPYEKKLGLTGPLSQALPTDAEKHQSDALIEELRRQNNYESAADTKKRYVLYCPLGRHRPRHKYELYFESWLTNSLFADTMSLIPYRRSQRNLSNESADLRDSLNTSSTGKVARSLPTAASY